jgi:predicted  nucleic acid-binding Zn-ribbon protein
MAMDAILKKLESRIEEFAQTHKKANDRVAELEARVEELEGQLGGSDDLDEKVRELEAQRAELADRLESVLGVIDSALEG